MGRIRDMGFTMKRIFMQLAAVVLAVAVAVPMAAPARAARNDELTLRVGLAYGSSALVSANLENNTALARRHLLQGSLVLFRLSSHSRSTQKI